MGDKMGLPVVQVKKWGVFDYPGLLHLIRNYLKDNAYTVIEKGHEYKGKEAKVGYTCTRNYTWFAQFKIDVYIHIRNLKHVKVVKDGEEKEMVEGRLIVEFAPTLQVDYRQTFEQTKFLKFCKGILLNYVWRKKIGGGWGDDLYYFVYRMHRKVKEFLDFETTTDASRYRIS